MIRKSIYIIALLSILLFVYLYINKRNKALTENAERQILGGFTEDEFRAEIMRLWTEKVRSGQYDWIAKEKDGGAWLEAIKKSVEEKNEQGNPVTVESEIKAAADRAAATAKSPNDSAWGADWLKGVIVEHFKLDYKDPEVRKIADRI